MGRLSTTECTYLPTYLPSPDRPWPPSPGHPPPQPSAQQDWAEKGVTPYPGGHDSRGHTGRDAARWAHAGGTRRTGTRGNGVPRTR